MKLEQFQQIIEIEKQTSISKAARALFMGQPALSGSLNSLEDEIGVRLFERSSSEVIPTPEGRDILSLARQTLELTNQITHYGQAHRELYGNVNVLIALAYSYLFPRILLLFAERYPKTTLQLKTASPQNVVQGLVDGTANIGVTL